MRWTMDTRLLVVVFLCILALVLWALWSLWAYWHVPAEQAKAEHTVAPVALEYRLGDVIKYNGMIRDCTLTCRDVDMGEETMKLYPGSIAAEFTAAARRAGFTGMCYSQPETCFPLLLDVARRECPKRILRFKEKFGEVPSVLVHVRTADVIDKSGKKIAGEAAGRPIEFYERLGPLLRKKGISEVTLVTSFNHRTNGNHEGPRLYLEKVRDLLARAGVQTRVIMTDDADMDFCLMASAPTLVPTRSGLSEFAAEVAIGNNNEVIGLWRRKDPDSVTLGVYNPALHKNSGGGNYFTLPGTT